jgi:hypothetical protein
MFGLISMLFFIQVHFTNVRARSGAVAQFLLPGLKREVEVPPFGIPLGLYFATWGGENSSVKSVPS